MSRKHYPGVRAARQRGATLVEVLVTMVILMVGLLGLIGVMIQSQRAQVESYQRVQAMLLVQDMANRITANRAAAACYNQTDPLGTNRAVGSVATGACAPPTGQPRALQDLKDWNELLKGSSELAGANAVGAILGARGCITESTIAGSAVYQVSVAWQGTQTGGAPPASINCGSGQYGDDALRRAVSITVQPSTI